ncbi:MAG: methyltransferase [Pseudomonadota bacterium]
MKQKKNLNLIRDTARAFQRSRVLLTAAELDVFTAVAGGADTPPKLARRLGCGERPVTMLLRALAGMGFLAKSGGRYGVNAASKALVDDGKSIGRKALLHTASGWERWSRMTEAIRKGKIAAGRKDLKHWRDHFIAAMEQASTMRAVPTARAMKPLLRRSSTLLDLGGGSGGYAPAFVEQNPDLSVTIFDQREVLPLTRKYLAASTRVKGRVKLAAGDFIADDIGKGFDIVFLSSIIHIYGSRTNMKLMKKIFGALNSGGSVVISDFILDDNEHTPVNAAIFGLHMLVSTEEGGTYTRGEIKGWMKKAGFRAIRIVDVKGTALLMAGRKP